MSKYEPLWIWIKENGGEGIRLGFDEIEKIVGVAVDHSFLTYKKDLISYGYKVGKISMKEKNMFFEKLKSDD